MGYVFWWPVPKSGGYERTAVNVEIVKKEVFPEGSYSGGLHWDFCPDCFTSRVQPLLETLAKPRETELSW